MRSLLDWLAVPCIKMEAVRTSDSEGGITTAWHEGKLFSAAFNRSRYGMRARAESSDDSVKAQKVAADVQCILAYNPATVELCYNDYIKRVKDNAIFRVTSDPAETVAPEWMAVRFAQCSAERAVLPI